MATSFVINAADLAKILAQIKVAEANSAGASLVDIIGKDNSLLPIGLRTVDGSYNHLLPGQEQVGSTGEPFPRLLTPDFRVETDGDTVTLVPAGAGGPGSPPIQITNNNYAPGSKSVADADPRIISNTIVDQTINNIAAIAAALAKAGAADPFSDALAIKGAYNALVEAQDAAAANVPALEAALAAAQAALPPLVQAATAAAGAQVVAQGEFDAAVTGRDAALAADTAADNALLALLNQPTPDPAAIFAAVQTSLQTQQALNAAQNLLTQETTELASANALVTSTSSAVTAQNTVIADAQTALDNATTSNQAVIDAQNALNSLLDAGGIEVSSDGTITIPHTSPDIGLSPSNSGWMTLFGQFFDHGLDLVPKGGNGTVYIPLQADDPLYDMGADGKVSADDGFGKDGIFGTADDSPNYMALTRATPTNGTEAVNTVTPFVDQNQTYTSDASHQAFLREYRFSVDTDNNGTNDAVAVNTGRLLNGANGGVATWADVKAQAAEKLGLKLSDIDVHNVPKLVVDAYGKIATGPNGFAQVYVTVTIVNPDGSTVAIPGSFAMEGVAGGLDLHNLPPPANLPPLGAGQTYQVSMVGAGVAFLNDIAHDAAPQFVDPDRNPFTNNSHWTTADTDTDTGNAQPLNGAGVRETYDDELLNKHYVTGDGRGNENIGLTAVHTVFHSEHNRLVEAYKATIVATAAGGDVAFLNEWLSNDVTTVPADLSTLVWDGERLFQAARFVTEMQYQHLVFEEFARRVQPNVDPFVFTNSAELNPAILAEFAHAVYRFGHSQLTDGVDRLENDLTTVNGDADQIGLIQAFLNPVEFGASGINDEQAAANIIRGMSRQVGNEIDEFVAESLRNNLVGLPLDLAALNIARGRETGIPSLNDARVELYAMTGDVDVKPYTSWFDFAQHMKNPVSIINFIAAYGKHPALASLATVEEKRAAALLLVMGDGNDADGVVINGVTYTDRLDYVNGTGAWNAENSGLNDVDLWVGGLAEEIKEFGGMLGSTFNLVFEYQMEHLQNGDRFYYLSRTQGMNLLNLLEANTFTELIMRNTDLGHLHSTHLPAEIMEVPDMILELDPLVAQEDYNGALAGKDPVWSDKFQQAFDPKVVKILGDIRLDSKGNAVLDAEGQVIRDGNVMTFSGGEHVVLGGTEGNDRLLSDKGIDTLWGDGGDDYLNAGMESDQVYGGDGDDIIEDPFGDDFLRGEAGNDVIVNSHGLDLLFGGEGQDFIMAVTDTTEVFAGPGDDFILGGSAPDGLMGNEGDDWIEGGEGFDSLSGENSELFFNSPIVGHDILWGQGNDTDYDGENGDDIMVQGAGIQRNNGMEGFDWAVHDGDTEAGNSDLSNFLGAGAVTPAFILRDRFDSVEGLSGWNKSDVLTGASRLIVAGGGFDSSLDQAGVDRIHGLSYLVSPVGAANPTGDPNAIILTSDRAFEGGEIILGGAGSDTITGNLGDDILDGDAWLNVRIAVMQNKDGTGPELFSVDSLAEIQARLRSGEINPGQLKSVREILNSDNTQLDLSVGTTNKAGDVDVAVFKDVIANYEIETRVDGTIGDADGDGFIRVAHIVTGGGGGGGGGGGRGARDSDGIDHIRNFEVLKFADDIAILDPTITNAAPTGLLGITVVNGAGAVAGTFDLGDTLVANLGTLADADGLPPISAFALTWQVEQTPGTWIDVTDPVTGGTITGLSFAPTEAFGLDGLRLRVVGTFRDGHGIPQVAVSTETTPFVGGAPVVPAAAVDLGVFDIAVGAVAIDIAALLVGVTDPNTPLSLLTIRDLAIRITDPNAELPGILDVVTNAAGDVLSAIFTPSASFVGPVKFDFNVSDGTNLTAGEALGDVNPPPTGMEILAADGTDDLKVTENEAGVVIGSVTVHDTTPGETFTFNVSDDRFEIIDEDNDASNGQQLILKLKDGISLDFETDRDVGIVVETFDSLGSPSIHNPYNFTVRTQDVRETAAGMSGGDGDDDIMGDRGRNIINGGSGKDHAWGQAGNDKFVASWNDGDDIYEGGSGYDTYDASAARLAVVIDLSKGTASGADIGNDTLVSIENAIGGAGNNTLIGTNGRNSLNGGLGNDTINGRSGNDSIVGGGGNDTMTGGSGNDRFVFNSGFGNDVITDFDANPNGGQDKIDIRSFGFDTVAQFNQHVHIIDAGRDVLIKIDNNDSITLKNVSNHHAVTINDFVVFGG